MITAAQCLKRYGPPELEKGMVLASFQVRPMTVPPRIYLNRDLHEPLIAVFNGLVNLGLEHLIQTWDGCFNIRKTRGRQSMSLHSWGLAIDINATGNGLGQHPTMHRDLVKAFEDAGFEWGGRWSRPDGMHFQLAKFPE